MSSDAEMALAGFLAKYTPGIEALAAAAIARLRKRLPGATLAVYDNYNALAVGFGPSDRTSEVICSVAVYPRWVLFFLARASELQDPLGLLQGNGKLWRHIPLTGADMFNEPEIEALLAQAVALAPRPIDPSAPGGVVIKSVSAKQRPRRPA